MQRFPDWSTRLDHYLATLRGQRFRYGIFDCCLFVCGAIEATTGTDPARSFRGLYHSRSDGRKLLRGAGGIAAIAAAHGMVEVSVNHAKRGDVVMLTGSSLGLVALNGRDVLVIGEEGLKAVPRGLAMRAWSV